VGHPDRTLREYAGGYHGLFADVNHQDVLRDLHQWIEAHLSDRSALIPSLARRDPAS
jgi:alpha-beta hydrolase superfamily lysophospholipase